MTREKPHSVSSGEAEQPRNLWNQLEQARSLEEAARLWLPIFAARMGKVRLAVIALGPEDAGPYAPRAIWPAKQPTSIEILMQHAAGVVPKRKTKAFILTGENGGKSQAIAVPLILQNKLYGVIAIEFEAGYDPNLADVEVKLLAGLGWFEAARSHQKFSEKTLLDQARGVTSEVLSLVTEQEDFSAACSSFVTYLAHELGAERVSFGSQFGRKFTLEAMSHSARFGSDMVKSKEILSVMKEAVKKADSSFLWQETEDTSSVLPPLLILSQNAGNVSAGVVPFAVSGNKTAALVIEWQKDPSEDMKQIVSLLQPLIRPIGAVLLEKYQNNRSIWTKLGQASHRQLSRLLGAGYLKRKLFVLALLLAVGCGTLIQAPLKIGADTVLEARQRRAIVAPYDGFIASIHARQGDRVAAGTLLGEMDVNKLKLQQLKWVSELSGNERRKREAQARGQRAEMTILDAKIAQTKTELDLVDKLIDQARLEAPFEAVILSGEIKELLGGSVTRGQLLFELAPADKYRVILKVSEQDIALITPTETGKMVLTSMPEKPLDIKIDRIEPVAQSEEGKTFFRVEAEFTNIDETLLQTYIRPGMKGNGKIGVGSHPLWYVWGRTFINWVQIQLFKWLP